MPDEKFCFISGPPRYCVSTCMAYVTEGKTSCRILNTLEKLVPPPTRPVSPAPPKVRT